MIQNLTRGVTMTTKPYHIFAILCAALVMGSVARAGSFEKNAFEGTKTTGEVRDRCLEDGIPVTIKQLDRNLYFVRVENRYRGQVTASSYGEARRIACSKKSQIILYNSEK